MKYKRILLKLSGESLMGTQQFGIDSERLNQYVSEIKEVVTKGVQVGIVIGGGNIFRGMSGVATGIDRLQGDYMGMMATMINSMAIQATLEKYGLKVKHLSGLAIDAICEQTSGRKSQEYLEEGYVVVISAGTGNPYFTTDTAASLRALEIKADAILKGTRVDGIYTADPEKDPNAKKYEQLTYNEAIEKKLNIMDLTAFALCSDNNLPIIVFDMNTPGNLLKLINGDNIGTIVKT